MLKIGAVTGQENEDHGPLQHRSTLEADGEMVVAIMSETDLVFAVAIASCRSSSHFEID